MSFVLNFPQREIVTGNEGRARREMDRRRRRGIEVRGFLEGK